MKFYARTPHQRWLALAASLLALAVGMVAWWLRSETAAPPPGNEGLKLGVARVLHSMPILVANENGYFRDEGLDVSIQPYPSGKAALDGLFRGEVEVADVAQTPIVFSSFRRDDFVVIATFLPDAPSSKLIVAGDSPIRTIADLTGRRVGVPQGTSAHFFLYVLLTDQGLARSDVVEVALAPPEMSTELLAGRVDAVAVFEPYASEAMAASHGRFFASKRFSETMAYVSLREFSQRRPGATQRLLRATDRACAWMRQHPSEAMAMTTRLLGIAEPALASLWGDFNPALGLDQTYLVSLEEQARWATSSGLVKPTPLPNFLHFLDFSALATVKPESITVIR